MLYGPWYDTSHSRADLPLLFLSLSSHQLGPLTLQVQPSFPLSFCAFVPHSLDKLPQTEDALSPRLQCKPQQTDGSRAPLASARTGSPHPLEGDDLLPGHISVHTVRHGQLDVPLCIARRLRSGPAALAIWLPLKGLCEGPLHRLSHLDGADHHLHFPLAAGETLDET